MDILAELDNKFKEIVTDQLDTRSRDALLTQQDPATMEDIEVVKIRKSILRCVYGKILSNFSCNKKGNGTVCQWCESGSKSGSAQFSLFTVPAFNAHTYRTGTFI